MSLLSWKKLPCILGHDLHSSNLEVIVPLLTKPHENCTARWMQLHLCSDLRLSLKDLLINPLEATDRIGQKMWMIQAVFRLCNCHQKRVSRLYCTDARSSWTAWFAFRTKAVAMRKLQPGQSLLSAFICTCKMEGSGEMVSGCFTAIECCSCGLLQVLPLPVGDGHCWNKVKGHGRWRRDGRVSPNPGCRGRWKRSAPHELVFLYINPLFLSKQKQRKKRKTEEECNGSDPTPRTSPFSNGGIRNKQELFVVD